MTATPPLLVLSSGDVAAPFEPDRVDVSSSHPLDINEDEYINENQPPRAEKGKVKVSCEDLGEGQFNDFSTYHLQTSDSELDFDWTDSNGDSLYNVDENIEDLLQVRKANIEKQSKEKVDRVNLDEIPSGPVGIDASFEDICNNKGVRYEGKLGGDEPYFDSSDPGSDISDEEEGDPVDDDEVVDPLPRTSSSKIYFDKTAKKVCFQLYMVFLNAIKFREALQSYSIQKGVNLKLKPNEKERVRTKYKHKGCPWVILGSVDNTRFFTVKLTSLYTSVVKGQEIRCATLCGLLSLNFCLISSFGLDRKSGVEGFWYVVELEDDSEELVCSTVGKIGVEHVVVHHILDMEVEEQSIMDFGSDYVELRHELEFEPESDDNGVFLTVSTVQLQ
ncbi:hypothetical protein FXO38_05429 [Capsicum annuum]|nr:hypothetical protein FXO37_21975 [Capsicum annuum]KAF3673930.1 hypothetical protein FXO38_05429 [Capsicum annuum]